MSHSNIALFVANAGCPYRCTFCNQFTITGEPETAKPEDVAPAVKTALRSGTRHAQLAFFGGSFTAIPRDDMVSLLKAAKPFVDDGSVTGIRISTRPDCIDNEILDILQEYGVESIELGAQSMCDEVLRLNRRGHSAEDIVRASEMVRSRGLELGLQMMTGLYGSSPEKDLETAKALTDLNPETVRIYPTIVIEGTELARLYRDGKYVPQSLDEAVDLGAQLLLLFENCSIRVIRLGLHSGGNVEDGYVAGPYHPAFRELCESRIYLQCAREKLWGKKPGNYTLFVRPTEISKMTGQKRKNIIELDKVQFHCRIRPDSGLRRYQVRVGGSDGIKITGNAGV